MQTPRRPHRRAWYTALSIALAGSLFAEASLSAPAGVADETVTLEMLSITGSRLDAPAGLSPVTVIDAAEIRRSGVDTNVLDVLRKQMPAFSGGANLGATNASVNATATYGGARLSLHNLPTLVLLNGRRVATNGANGRGGSSFVDVNQFPLAAIERIEVLTDGGSAVYGSDAIGGVVNVILKKSYQGSEAGARYAFSNRDGDYSEKSAWFTSGASQGGLGIVVSGTYSKATPLMQSDRPFSNVANSTLYSGVVGSAMLAPGVNSPSDRVPTGVNGAAANIAELIANGTYVSGVTPLNLADYVTLLTRQEKRSGYAALNADLAGKRLQFFADVLYSETDTGSQLGAQNVTFNGVGTNPPSVPNDAPYNPFVGVGATAAFRYVPAPRQYENESALFRVTAGLRGELSPSWNWEAAYTRNDNRLVARIHNVLFGPNLSLAVAGGYDAAGNVVAGGAYSRVYTGFTTTGDTVLQPALDPYANSAGIDPASLANVLGVSRADFKSRLDSLDLVVRGKVFDLPAGSISVAAGGERREEGLSGTPDENSRNTGPTRARWVGGTLFDPFDRDREVAAGYAEIGVPVMNRTWNVPGIASLDASVAYRLEHYSDAGTSRAPKLGARWRPLDEQVTVRYSFSKAFAAPRLYDLFGPVTEGRSSDLKSLLGLPGTASMMARTQRGANDSLKPMRSRSHSAGLTFAPRQVKGLAFSIDYLEAKLEDMTGTVTTSTIVESVNRLGAASPYAGQVARNNFAGKIGAVAFTAPGEIRQFLLDPNNDPASLFVSEYTVNISAARVRVMDFALEYERTLPDDSVLSYGTRATWFIDNLVQALPSEPYYEYAGHMTSSSEGTLPSCRFYTTLGWKKQAWEVQIGHSYVPSVDDIGAGGETFAQSASLKAMHMDSYMTWDLAVGYTFVFFQGSDRRIPLRLSVGVNNLSDELPPVSTQAFASPSFPSADTSTYSPVGRLFYVSADVTF